MTYVLSDIHGNLRRFESIMAQINLQPDDTLYVLGDVIDRYPDGIKILRQIMQMPNAKMLIGNHEYMMLKAIGHCKDAKDGSPYLAIFCHVRKKDVPKFLAALEDLKKSMILCGHPHYEDEISSIMDKMEKMKGAQHGDENDAAQETEQKRTA